MPRKYVIKNPRKPRKTDAEKYFASIVSNADARRLENQAMRTAASQDIGDIPPCKNPERRAACLANHALFCKTYFPQMFDMEWSKDHLRILPKTEVIVDAGGKKAIAMPRGSGKTVICLTTVLRAQLSGKHPFAFYIGATKKKQEEGMLWFKTVLLTNDLLLEDFPEVCYPIRRMNGEPRRCLGQTSNGVNTKIKWSPDKIFFPIIENSPLSGFCLAVSSMESAIRGGFIILPDGSMPRPSIAVVDDPQTDESAKSQGPNSQTEKRMGTIVRAIQGLAGPNGRISILIPCTVIEKGDLADQILDRKKHPDFYGERTRRLYSWPTNMKFWDKYREIREDCMRADEPPTEATEYYRARMCTQGRRLDDARDCPNCPNKSNCMDCGAVVDWAERMGNKPDMPVEFANISSLQDAMHSFYEYGQKGFASEFQNEPLTPESEGKRLTPEIIVSRVSGRQWGEVPLDYPILTCGIDVQQYSIWYSVVAWKMNFTGHVVDYGIWPQQERRDVKKSDIEGSMSSLQAMYPNKGIEGTIQAGLEDLIPRLLARNFQKAGGFGLARIGQMLVDSSAWPNVIHAVKTSRGGAVMSPCRGEGIGAGGRPMASRKRKEGERWDPLGHWYFPTVKGTREFPACVLDTNWWKSFVHSGFLTSPGDPGAITLFGNDPERHSLFASHITAETYVTPISPKGIPVDEWTLRPGRPDNEWLDTLVYSAVAASMMGCKRTGNEFRGAAKIINVPTPRWAKVK